jgi:chemotaxis protein MotB
MAGMIKRFFEQRKKEAPIWLTVYSDMMTNLMLFFLMLFALTQRGQQAMNSAAIAFSEEITKGAGIEAEMSEVLKEELRAMESESVEVRFEADATRIILSEPVVYDSAKAELESHAIEILHELAVKLRSLPNKFVVEGHTDNLPIRRGKYKSNWDLSSARAENIIKYFVHKELYPPEQFAVAAYGKHRPIAPNDTSFNRRKNRRVELVVLRK